MLFLISGEVIKTGDIKCVMGEGMPVHRDPFTKGRLIIRFKIIFPPSGFIKPNKIGDLEKCLPTREQPMIPDGAEEHTLAEFDPENDMRNRHRYEAYDDDDDQTGQRVQCASH